MSKEKKELEEFLGDGTLDDYWKYMTAAVQQFLATRCSPDGTLERFGTTPECLTIPEFDDYLEGKISRPRKERYDSHIAGCEDCMGVIETFREYAVKHPFLFMARRALSLPHRFIDYIYERNLAQLGPAQQASSVGYQ